MESTFPRSALNSDALARAQRNSLAPIGRRGVLQDIDRHTLELAQSGNRAALGRLIEHYQDLVFAFLSRALGRHHRVEDLAQEVFLRVMCALPQFEVRDAKVATWILQIAVRLLQDEGRRNRSALTTAVDQIQATQPDPERLSAAKEQLTRVERAADSLPDEQRVALILLEFHGLTHSEIARATGCSPLTVKTRIFRARRFLEKTLERDALAETEHLR